MSLTITRSPNSKSKPVTDGSSFAREERMSLASVRTYAEHIPRPVVSKPVGKSRHFPFSWLAEIWTGEDAVLRISAGRITNFT